MRNTQAHIDKLETPETMPTSRCAALLAGLILALAACPAPAAEISTFLGANAATSAWRGDGGGGFHVAMAGRWRGWLGAELLLYEQLLAVDQRVDTGITVGLTATLPRDGVRPGVRLFAIHQHEEGLVSVRDHPWGTVFGIGTGIRHRAGGGVDLRAEKTMLDTPFGALQVRGGLTGVWFPDATLGPAWYLGLTADVGLLWTVIAK